MKTIHFKHLLSRKVIFRKAVINIVLLLPLINISCNNEDEFVNTSGEINIAEVLDAMGGWQVVEGVKTISYTVDGANYEWEQPKPIAPNPLTGGSYHYDYAIELNSRKVRFDYAYIKYDNPFPYDTYDGLMVVNDKKGTLSGTYHWLSYYFGLTQPTAIYPSRVEAILKNQKMANPIEMLKEVIERNGKEVMTTDQAFSIPTRVEELKIFLEIDKTTALPTKAKVMEEDFMNGDVWYETTFENWVSVGGTKFPSKITSHLNGKLIRQDELSQISINPAFDSDHFIPLEPEIPRAYDERMADHGIYYSQWHHRWLAWGIPIDQPLDNGALVLDKFDLTPFGLPNQAAESPLKIIGRPDLRTWSVAIKTDEGIYVVDAPINTFWTGSIVRAIKNEFPGEKLVAAISTHTHHVTFGGIRELVHETGKLYVGDAGVEMAKTAINAEHTLVPDTFQKDRRNVEIIPVSGVTKLAGGAIEIHKLVTSDPIGTPTSGPHAEDMVIVYVPEAETVIQADHYWSGEFMIIWDGYTKHNYTTRGQAELKRIAKYLLDYVTEKELKVSKFIGIHGGVGTLEELKKVAE